MRTLYLVQEVSWQYDDQWFYEDGTVPRKAFAVRTDAETFCREQESVKREEIVAKVPDSDYDWWSNNMIHTFGGWEHVSSLSVADLNARFAPMGLPVAGAGEDGDWEPNDYWYRFWKVADTPEKRDAVWQLFDLVRFYEVVELEAEL